MASSEISAKANSGNIRGGGESFTSGYSEAMEGQKNHSTHPSSARGTILASMDFFNWFLWISFLYLFLVCFVL